MASKLSHSQGLEGIGNRELRSRERPPIGIYFLMISHEALFIVWENFANSRNYGYPQMEYIPSILARKTRYCGLKSDNTLVGGECRSI